MFRGSLRRSNVVSPLPFFGVVVARLDRRLECATLMIASLFHNGLIARGEGGFRGCRFGEMFHLIEVGGVMK